MKKAILILGLTLINSNLYANIVCKGTSKHSGQPFSVEISNKSVIVRGGSLSEPHVFNNLVRYNGLTTAPGLAITFSNDYGCIRRATIITELLEPFGAGYMETLNVFACSGGSTPDDICGVH